MAHWKKLLLIGVATSVVTLAALVLFSSLRGQPAPPKQTQGWNAGAIRATFAAVEVHQVNSANAAIFFYYDVENNSGSDYQLDAGQNLRLMSRLKSDGSLVSDKRTRLADNVFVPVSNRTRIGIELDCPFAWPSQKDSAADGKIRALVSEQTSNLRGFVLFDSNSRFEIELVGGWN